MPLHTSWTDQLGVIYSTYNSFFAEKHMHVLWLTAMTAKKFPATRLGRVRIPTHTHNKIDQPDHHPDICVQFAGSILSNFTGNNVALIHTIGEFPRAHPPRGACQYISPNHLQHAHEISALHRDECTKEVTERREFMWSPWEITGIKRPNSSSHLRSFFVF